MTGKSGIAVALAALATASGAAFAAPPEGQTLVDQFVAGKACALHAADPDLVWLETIGSVDGVRHEKLVDELSVVLNTLQEMMIETRSRREDIIELRVSTTSGAYQREIMRTIALNPELSGIPFTYRTVDGFSVKWARVGLDAVLHTPEARGAVAPWGGPDLRAACGGSFERPGQRLG